MILPPLKEYKIAFFNRGKIQRCEYTGLDRNCLMLKRCSRLLAKGSG